MLDDEPELKDACVATDGRMIDRNGRHIGWRVPDCGREIVDERDRVVGIITRNGRVYNRHGQFVSVVARYDLAGEEII